MYGGYVGKNSGSDEIQAEVVRVKYYDTCYTQMIHQKSYIYIMKKISVHAHAYIYLYTEKIQMWHW